VKKRPFEILIKETTIPAWYRDYWDGVYAGKPPSPSKPVELLVVALGVSRIYFNDPSSVSTVRGGRESLLSPCVIGDSIIRQGESEVSLG
jgi:hypothetical protein